jgi:hypothetical protein
MTVQRKPSRFGWLERTNIITMAALIRRNFPDYPIVTANQLDLLTDEEIHRIFGQLNSMMRSIGQLGERS